MKQLDPKQIEDNYNTLLSYIDTYIASPRKEQLRKLYDDHAERIALMPASGTEHYHNCFPGGYVDHVIRVVEAALRVKDLWLDFGATINYTKEELVFAAINHDLGKIGTEIAEQFIQNDSEWHRKNQGKLYKNNSVNAFMTVPDRSLKLLTDRGIAISENEWFGIKLHDGMYEDSNKAYYIGHDPSSRLRTNLPYVLHQADQLAARVEYEMWVREAQIKPSSKPTTFSQKNQAPLSEDRRKGLQETFNKMFNP